MKLPGLTLALLSTLLLIFLSPPTADAADVVDSNCGTTGNYTANSTYYSNLQTLLTNLTTSANKSSFNFGFAKSTIGSVPNQLYGLVLCRGDVSYSVCSSCLSQATQEIQNLCPYNKDATVYYDPCFLRYSNQNFLSSTVNSNPPMSVNTQNVSVSFTLFDNLVDYLINSTADYAAFNNSKKFGTSQMNTTGSFPVIRGLVQCTPDMSGTNCRSCLQDIIAPMNLYFSGKQGGRILGVMCNIRYEIYSFYNGAAMLTLTAPAENAPAPAPALPPGVTNPPPKGVDNSLLFYMVAPLTLVVQRGQLGLLLGAKVKVADVEV